MKPYPWEQPFSANSLTNITHVILESAYDVNPYARQALLNNQHYITVKKM